MEKTEGKTMHGNPKVIEQLNAGLASELTAIVQYMVQSETCQNWGYVRIGDHLKRRAIEEMGHRPCRARTRYGCHSAKILDVSPNH